MPRQYPLAVGQLPMGLEDTDGRARSIRRIESRRKWETRLANGILRRAIAIHRGADQDTRILCPIGADGMWCSWVAGHYGGHNLGRPNRQRHLA